MVTVAIDSRGLSQRRLSALRSYLPGGAGAPLGSTSAVRQIASRSQALSLMVLKKEVLVLVQNGLVEPFPARRRPPAVTIMVLPRERLLQERLDEPDLAL